MQKEIFDELYEMDISEHTIVRKMKDGDFTYLPWEACLRILKARFVNVSYSFLHNDSGYPAFFDPNGMNPFVSVGLNIDGVSYSYDYPVIDGDFVKNRPHQLDIHIAQQRAFVKAVAVKTGLGLKLWQKDAKEVSVSNTDSAGRSMVIEFGKKIQEFGDADSLLKNLGTSKKEMDALMKGGALEDIMAMTVRITNAMPDDK